MRRMKAAKPKTRPHDGRIRLLIAQANPTSSLTLQRASARKCPGVCSLSNAVAQKQEEPHYSIDETADKT